MDNFFDEHSESKKLQDFFNMPYINSTKFGEIIIDNKSYHQVLIINDLVIERDYERLKKLFDTSHKIGDWETAELIKRKPDIIIIGTGQDGLLEVEDDFLNKMQKQNIKVISTKTPEAIKIFNEHLKAGKRINALIHTTC